MNNKQMKDLHSKHKGCRLCGSSLLSCVIPLSPVPIGEHYSDEPLADSTRYPIDIYQCLECGAVQTNDDINPEFLWKDYTYFSGHTKRIVEHFDQFAKDELLRINVDKPRVLDIGSNDGTLLKSFLRLGCSVKGVDPASTVVAKAREDGINTILGLFNSELAESIKNEGRYDIITAFNVFAHSQEMSSMLDGVKTLLDTGGIFSFEVQYLEDISRKKLLGTFFHEHMVHYSLDSARSFLNSHDLEVVDFERNNIQNGSIIIHACHKSDLSYFNDSGIQRVRAQIDAEYSQGLNSLLWGAEFSHSIYSTRQQLADFLVDHGCSELVAFGAARSGPTLAIQFGLDGKITRLYDDHPSKVGKYSPYRGLKVYPTQDLSAESSPVCVILAYIHYRNIIKGNTAYLDSGGKFILLWPEFQVVSKLNYSVFLSD